MRRRERGLKLKEKAESQGDLIHAVAVSHFASINKSLCLFIKIQIISYTLYFIYYTYNHFVPFFIPPAELPEEDLHPGDSVGCSRCYYWTHHLGRCKTMKASSSSTSTSSPPLLLFSHQPGHRMKHRSSSLYLPPLKRGVIETVCFSLTRVLRFCSPLCPDRTLLHCENNTSTGF